MTTCNRLAAVLAAVLFPISFTATAQVIGGGNTATEALYNEILTTAPLPGFSPYIGAGAETGARALVVDDAMLLGLGDVTVDYAGVDRSLTEPEIALYHAAPRDAYGPVLQVPLALSAVGIAYHVPGMSQFDLTSAQLAAIVAGNITNWSQLGGPNQPLVMVYRLDGTGTTGVLLRHLNAVAPGSVPNVGRFFATAINATAPNYLGVSGSEDMAATIAATPYTIGYLGPEGADFADATQVARLNGYLPSEVLVSAVMAGIGIPTGSDQLNPLNWAIEQAVPSNGYAVVGAEYLWFGQCYQSAQDTARVRAFINAFGSGAYDAAFVAAGLHPLPANWEAALRQAFATTGSAGAVGNTNVCPGIGRPL